MQKEKLFSCVKQHSKETLLVRPSIRLSVHPSIRPPVRLSKHPSIGPSFHPSVHLSILLYFRPTVHGFLRNAFPKNRIKKVEFKQVNAGLALILHIYAGSAMFAIYFDMFSPITHFSELIFFFSRFPSSSYCLSLSFLLSFLYSCFF